METPVIRIGILHATKVHFSLNGEFSYPESNSKLNGDFCVSAKGSNLIILKGNDILEVGSGIIISPVNPNKSDFTIYDVVIGINFHWERKENQVFKGSIQFIVEDGKIWAINVLSIEDYLTSVISSEMNATSSMELLKAHAVTSRSWLLAQIEKKKTIRQSNKKYKSHIETDTERVRWYDREDHLNFDVCADDHCQRYQGITRASTSFVEEAIHATWGEILVSGDSICDARFSKCCGGISELFENTWEPVNHRYLQKIIDNPEEPAGWNLDLTNEGNAVKWILTKPDAFCNTSDKKVLKQVLNDYDQETNDFYRWKVVYSQSELSELVKIRSGIDFGTIIEMVPLERGVSGRIKRLKIIGIKKTFIIGKELEIRKTLSKSHLYSSAFVVTTAENKNGKTFTLTGAGWGHGVGLCQIGAAMMGANGFSYKVILMHYFRGAGLEKRY